MKRRWIVMFGIMATVATGLAAPFGPTVRIADAATLAEDDRRLEAYTNSEILKRIAISLKVKVNKEVDPKYYLEIYRVPATDNDETYLVVGRRPPFASVPLRHWLLRPDEGQGMRILADIGPADIVHIGRTERGGYRDLIVSRDGAERVMTYITNAGRYRYAK